MKKKISVIGLGYIGLPTALLIANKNRIIDAYDNNEKKIEFYNFNKLDLKEKSIRELFKKKKNFLRFNNFLKPSDIYIICVPTPTKKVSKYNSQANLKILYSVIDKISKIIKKNDLIIIESTCPPGNVDNIFKKFKILKKLKIDIVVSPERAIPGNTINEMIYNPRIFGIDNLRLKKILLNLYNFSKGPKIFCKPTEAELTKLFENTFRDINIAIANEFDNICSKFKINTKKVIKFANLHPRVNIHTPGIGVGGHCIPVDPWFLLENSKSNLIKISRKINLNKENQVVKKIEKICIDSNYKKILLIGKSYKENIDDLRNSPSLNIFNKLKKKYHKTHIFDPLIDGFENSYYKRLKKIKFDLIATLIKHKINKKIKIKSIKKIQL